MKGKIHLMKFVILIFCSILFFAITLMLFYEYKDKNNGLKRAVENFEELYIGFQKEQLQGDIKTVCKMIELEVDRNRKEADKLLKTRVDLIEKILLEYYDQRDKVEVLDLIQKKLRNEQFFDGLGYYFVRDLSGRTIINSSTPDLEGTYLNDIKDERTKTIAKKIFNFALKNQEGYLEYEWKKVGHEGLYPKRSYIKRIDTLGIVIGTGIYIDDIDSDIQSRLKDILMEMRLSNESNRYLYILDYAGYILMHPIEPNLIGTHISSISSSDGERIFNAHKEAIRNDSTYTNYDYVNPDTNLVEQKLTYIKRIEELQWTIGSGIYISEIHEEVEKSRKNYKVDMIKTTSTFFSIFLVLIFYIIIIFFIVNLYLEKDLLLVINGFSKYNGLIDIKKLKFKEVSKIAYYANMMTVNNIKMSDRLLHLAHTDELTSLPNRRSFFEELNKLSDSNKEFAIAMIDIDYFKKVNDTYGHHIGDKTLKNFATLLNTRKFPFIARLGGEEFAIIFKNCSTSEACILLEKLRKDTEALIIDRELNLRITISIGLASSIEFPKLTSEEILNRADERLYIAKNCGRNKLVSICTTYR